MGYNMCVYAMGHIIWSSDDFAMGLCVEHSDDVDFWKVGEVSRRARPGMEQITGPVVREMGASSKGATVEQRR